MPTETSAAPPAPTPEQYHRYGMDPLPGPDPLRPHGR